ncbi:glycosyltransferase family 4 protein [Rhizobium sp. ZPR3]|uniref:Glycosyltransferase family 4 protein n=2 Tax=unclassified Rhizobium TaxID=2613769 RepID=A0AAU7SAL6_9HYPH
MKVIFINYGIFNSNSGGHVAYFANSISRYVEEVMVIGQGDEAALAEYGHRRFRVAQFPDPADSIPAEILEFAASGETIIHAWTPRGNVIQLVDRLARESGAPYVVHLEDNEELLLAANLGMSVDTLNNMDSRSLDKIVPLHLSHPRKAAAFLSQAVGVTMIVSALDKFRPNAVPGHVLEPGVDDETFAPNLSSARRETLREELYIDKDAIAIAYHGNIHSANVAEVFSLYSAVLILRRRGHNVVLIRAGRDFVDNVDPSFAYLKGEWVINLGFLDRARLIEVLKLADIFVQPGAPGEFNDYRLPSKIPEFLSLGKPVLLPKTNIGHRLIDGQNALLLGRGDGMDIANRIEELIRAPERGEAIGKGGRDFARKELNWDVNARALQEFYQFVLLRSNELALKG